MKTILSAISTAAVVTAASLFAAPAAYAVTSPTTIGDFDATPSQAFQIRPKSWSDPAFGDAGWTHHSQWGMFHAQAGQTVKIKAVAANPDIHPGITAWYRGAKDTAPDNYVTDHFYMQNAPQFMLGAKDETTGDAIGNIVMNVAGYGYDLDKNIRVLRLGAKRDGVSGQFTLTFTAKNTGTYMFVLGGFNPGPGITNFSIKYDVAVDVTVSP